MLSSTYGVVGDFVTGKLPNLSRVHLLGRAGTGKSYGVHQLTSYLQSKGKRIVKCAFTNEIADQLKGMTLHRAFGLGVTTEGSEIVKSSSPASRADFIFLDEYTLVGKRDWFLINKILQDCKAKLILVGDPYQLPPVKGKPTIVMTPEDTFELTTQYRNPEMSQMIEWFVWHVKTGHKIDIEELKSICTHGSLEEFIGHDGSDFDSPVILGYNNNLFHSIDQTYPALDKENWILCSPNWERMEMIGSIVPRARDVQLQRNVIPEWSLTVHKAQGRTFQGSPIVMLDNILQAPSHIRNQLLYVACTRGTKLPLLCTDPYVKPKRKAAFI